VWPYVVVPLSLTGLVILFTWRLHQSSNFAKEAPSPSIPNSPPSFTPTNSPTASVPDAPKAESLDQLIKRAKNKINGQATSAELKATKAELLAIPQSSSRHSEIQQLISRFDTAIAAAEKEEQRATSRWEYRREPDEMGRGIEKVGALDSTSTLDFGFPYSGEQHLKLLLLDRPKDGKNIAIQIEHGQFHCGYPTCIIAIRLDGGKVQNFKAEQGVGYKSGDVLFFMKYDYDRFLILLRSSKKMQMEVSFFREGARVVEFDTAGLQW
jgi:hypothetical protein